jgi:dUTP pyrophosphatase
MDVVACLDTALHLEPLERALVPTGIALAIPDGYEAQVRPRSGLALRKGITVLNAPGTIDNDYRGEVAVLLVNLSSEPQVIEPGERIAQLVFAPATHTTLHETTTLDNTPRGAGGFGSTGMEAIC